MNNPRRYASGRSASAGEWLAARSVAADVVLALGVAPLGNARGHAQLDRRSGRLPSARRPPGLAREEARALAELLDFDPTTTQSVSHWVHHGSGHSTGKELLAATVRHDGPINGSSRWKAATNHDSDRP
ncbi:hypothetical protein [Streptomyces sp. NPDC048385]